MWVSDTTKTVNDNKIIIQIQIGNMFPLTSLTHLHCALVQEQQSDIRMFDLVLEMCLRASAKQFQFGQSLGSVNEAGSFGVERSPWWGWSTAREPLNRWNVFIATQLSFCETNIKVSTIFYKYKRSAPLTKHRSLKRDRFLVLCMSDKLKSCSYVSPVMQFCL